MLRREIETVKGVILTRDFVFREYFKTERHKGVVQVIAHLLDRVQAAVQGRDAGQGKIRFKVEGAGFIQQLLQLHVERVRQRRFSPVCCLSCLAAGIRIQFAELFQKLGQTAFLAEQRAP